MVVIFRDNKNAFALRGRSQKSLFLKIISDRFFFGCSHPLHLPLEQRRDCEAGQSEEEASQEDDPLVVRDPVDVEAEEGSASDQVHGNAKPGIDSI